MIRSREATGIVLAVFCGLIVPVLWADEAARYAVHTKGKIGFIDRAGKMIIEPQFEDAIHFQDGVASVKAHGKWGYVDSNGKWVISPRYDEARTFYHGLGTVRVGSKWGFINREGKWAIPLQYDLARSFVDSGVPGAELTFARVKTGNQWMLIDTRGKPVLKPQVD